MNLADNLIKRVGRSLNHKLKLVTATIKNSEQKSFLSHALSEIDAATIAIETALGRNTATKFITARQLKEAERSYLQLDFYVKSALKEENETTAMTAIDRQLDIEAQISRLKTTISQCRDRQKKLEDSLVSLRYKKQQLSDKTKHRELLLKLSKNDKLTDEDQFQVVAEHQLMIKAVNAHLTFDRISAQYVRSMDPSLEDVKKYGALTELEKMAHKSQIEKRLAAAKLKMKTDA